MRDHRALVNKLQNFIILESENQRTQLMKKWSRPLFERVARGDAITGLSVVSSMFDGRITLDCKRNDSRFREGDFLLLHKGNPLDQNSILVSLEQDDETRLIVQLNDGDIYELEEQPDDWIADEGFLDLTPYYMETLNLVADTQNGREIILPLLTGELIPRVDFDRYESAFDQCMQAGLNKSQSEAVGYGYSTDLVHLIKGPPGTGKTFVLAHLAKQFVDDGLNVYVTALTHRAINNALNKIAQVDCDLPICKIGKDGRATDLNVMNFESFFGSGFDEISGGYVIGATPFASRTTRLRDVEFDVVIFDESSQVTLPLAMMGMLPAKKYIFIGDEYQLPPVVTSKAGDLAKYSVFEFLANRGYDTMLTTTYRLNRELAEWPSRIFYSGQIQPSEEAANRKLKHQSNAPHLRAIFDSNRSKVFVDLRHRDSTVKNYEEAELVCEIIAELFASNISPGEIGVVVPYRVQSRVIRNRLRHKLGDHKDLDELVVDTVERMQGQEREVILVSLTTSDPAFASQLGEFFFQPQRLNVAITRPRTKLIILGSSHVLEASSTDSEVSNWIGLFKDLLESCKLITKDLLFQ